MLNRESMEAKPLLRWAGSKRQLLPQLLAHAPSAYDCYVEPFVGSGSLYFALSPTHAVLGDVNPDLINFYVQLRSRPRDLHRESSGLSRSPGAYALHRDEYNHELQPFRRAVLFWYLNRSCFNGLYRTNQSGGFNVPMGRKLAPFPLVDAADRVSAAMRSAFLNVGDFQETINLADKGDFLYVDPPYHRSDERNRGEYGLNAMQDSELWRLIEAVQAAAERGAKILFSYNADLTSSLTGWSRTSVRGRYSIGAEAKMRREVGEFIFSNYQT